MENKLQVVGLVVLAVCAAVLLAAWAGAIGDACRQIGQGFAGAGS
jgi:hypothetical protein